MIGRALLAGWVCVAFSTIAAAQMETIQGKVAAVELRGRTTRLTVSADETEHVFELPAKVELEIVSAGDDACLAPGLFVEVDSIQSNNLFFGTVLSIYPDRAGKATPAAATKAAREAGQSVNRHFVSGEIAKFTAKPDEKYDGLDLKGTGRSVLSVYVERKRKIRVVQSDPKLIAEGQKVSVTGRKSGAKLLPAQVTIETGQTLKGDELLASLKRKR
jgi:hypothetical protein